MQLALSVRVAESFANKRVADIALADLAQIARAAGYAALCMRASQVGVHSTSAQIAQARQVMDTQGLAVSMVTGDFAVPENGAAGPDCLRNITPYLDLAAALGSDLIRICMKHEADIPFAQRAADEAAERGIRLAHQSHTQSIFETVAGSLDILGRVGRANFGMIYEPANLALCGENYGVATLQALQPYLFNVYVQNHAPDPAGTLPTTTWARGQIQSTLRPLDEPGGIDFTQVFDGLRAIGYTGYVTCHQAFGNMLPPAEAAQRSAAFLRSKWQVAGGK